MFLSFYNQKDEKRPHFLTESFVLLYRGSTKKVKAIKIHCLGLILPNCRKALYFFDRSFTKPRNRVNSTLRK